MQHRHECLLEACDLVSAILASDGRLTTSELEAWLDDIGPQLAPPVLISPQQLRESDLITSKAGWLDTPSTMFDLLVKADARDGARRANAYYDLALKLAHAAMKDWYAKKGIQTGQFRFNEDQQIYLGMAQAWCTKMRPELARLRAHLAEIERLLRKGGEVGKRLDFLIQELQREANTLGSKSAALELTNVSVEMKVLVEQMREQVQNLE